MHNLSTITQIYTMLKDTSEGISALLGEPVEVSLIRPQLVLPKIEYVHSDELKKDYWIMQIYTTVCEHFMVSLESMKTGTRKREVVDAKRCVSYIINKFVRNVTDLEIAKVIGCERSTVVFYRTTAEELKVTDKAFALRYKTILKALSLKEPKQ